MRIVHIANLYGPKSGGLKTTMNELSRQYSAAGHAVTLIVPGNKNTVESRDGISILTIKSPAIPFSGEYRMIFNIWRVIRLLKEFGPDIVEISDRATLLLVANWCKKQKIPTIFFAHERLDGVLRTFLPKLPFQKNLVYFWNQLTALSFSKIIATTKYASEEFNEVLSKHLPSSQPIEIVPLGVDLKLFKPQRTYRKDLFLFACTRLSKEKDPFFLLDISREIVNRRLDLPIFIAGSGPLGPRMKKVIESENLDVQLLGHISEKPELASIMSRASVFLAVGPIETFGLAALEALASGTPVLCRKSGAIKEVISSDTGLSLERDAVQWVDGIERLLLEDHSVISRRARLRAETFTWEICADSLLCSYEKDFVL